MVCQGHEQENSCGVQGKGTGWQAALHQYTLRIQERPGGQEPLDCRRRCCCGGKGNLPPVYFRLRSDTDCQGTQKAQGADPCGLCKKQRQKCSCGQTDG